MSTRCVGIVVCVALAGCRDSSGDAACTPASARTACDETADVALCGWARLLDDDADGSAIGAAVGTEEVALEARLRAALPLLAGKTLDDDVAPETPPPVFAFKTFPPYTVALPVDWAADPNANTTWRLELQSLSWIASIDLDAAALVVRDFGERALAQEPSLEFTWDDAGASKRLNAVSTFFDAYVASREVLDRRVVHAVARIVLCHLYSLSTVTCYAEKDNHGMMENVAVLAHLRDVPDLANGDELWDVVLARTAAHVAAQVAADGLDVEHSAAYHALYLGLLVSAISAIEDAGETPPATMLATRDEMFGAAADLLQPDGTFPQLGDTEDADEASFLSNRLAIARDQTASAGGADALDELTWVLSSGATGTAPSRVDRVFRQTGVAAFRDRWALDDTAITAHLTCSPELRSSHYHRDEGSFEIYGFGTQLVVDSGKYSYDRADALTAYQYSPFAHNVLVVDGADYDTSETAQIVDAELGELTSWVQAQPHVYDDLGVAHTRTFAFVRPSTFVVLDAIAATAPHRYDVHLHLGPTLDQLDLLDGHTLRATPSGGGPTLVIAAPAATLATVKGQRGDAYQGWYFPIWREAVATSDVIATSRAEGDAALPIVMTIAAPGTAAIVPTDVTYTVDGAEATVSWTADGAAHVLTVPVQP